MTRLQKIETAVYACLWAFAAHLAHQHLTKPIPPPEPPVVTKKLTAKQVMTGVRK